VKPEHSAKYKDFYPNLSLWAITFETEMLES